jgi:DNA-binding SARP family transcriptional activator
MVTPGLIEIPPLSILLLGPPQVILNGQLVKINRREQRAGLFFLAGQMEPVSRAEICDIFWPEDSEELSRKKLREGLSRIRSALKDPDIIISNNDFVSLDSSRVYIDAREYNNIVLPLLNSSELNSSGELPDWLYTQLRNAITLCRGHHFLQDLSLHGSIGFENWVALTNQAFNFSREKIIERLAEHCIAKGNIDEAILWLGRITSFDQLNTDINYLMLNCLRERRRFKEALDFVNFLQQIYKANHPDGMPVILNDMRKRIIREESETKKIKEIEWPGEEENAIPFVGRSDLLVRLNNAYQRKGIVHITGESGAGKTRLVQEFYSRLEFKPRLLFCIGKPMTSSSPFTPLIEGLRGSITEKEWSRVPEKMRIDMKNLFLELENKKQEKETINAEPVAEKPLEYIYNTLLNLFESLSEKRPLLMVIDIAQWCDDATLGFLTYLNEHQFFKRRGLLALISRTEEHNPTLDIYIDRSVLANNLEKIVLFPFTLEETAKLISVVMGKSFSEELVCKIQTETGGNPFYLIETLNAINLYDLDTSHFSKTDLYPVPLTIRSIVHEKVRSLSKSAQNILLSAAVLGQRFLPEVLEAMMGMNDEAYVSALEELQQKTILLGESGLQTVSYYEFPHDQIREVILQEMSPARKRNLHLAAVKALLEVKGNVPDMASIYAYHYEQAGEMTSAFSSWCVAGKYARRCFSRDDTYTAYQRAMDLLPSLPANDFSPNFRQLLVEWGDYAYDLNDDLTCEKLYSAGLDYGESRQDALIIGMALSGMGRVAEMRNDIEKGIDYLDRALFFFTQTETCAEKLEAYARLGLLQELKIDFKSAKETLLKGLEIGIDFKYPRSVDAGVNLQTQLSMAYCLMGWPFKAEEVALQVFNESHLISRPSAKVQGGAVLAMAQYYSGKYKKSLENAMSVYKLANQLNLEWWASLLDLVIARDHLVMGHLDESWFYASHAIDIKNKELLHTLVSHSVAIKGDIYRILGDFEVAEEQYRLGCQQPLVDFQSLENRFSLGVTLCQKSDISNGLAVIQEALVFSEQKGFELITLAARIMLEIYSMKEGDVNRFQERTEPTLALMKDRGFGSNLLNVELVKGNILTQKGNPLEAKQIYSQVVDSARKINHQWYELWAYCALAKIPGQTREEKELHLARITKILDEVAMHANKRPVLGLFHRYRKSLEKTL